MLYLLRAFCIYRTYSEDRKIIYWLFKFLLYARISFAEFLAVGGKSALVDYILLCTLGLQIRASGREIMLSMAAYSARIANLFAVCQVDPH